MDQALQQTTLPPVAFEVAREQLQDLAANAAPMIHALNVRSADVHEARMPLKNARLAIEARRKELVAPALEFQRQVNDSAAALIELVQPTEKALEAKQRSLEAEERAEKERQRRAQFDEAAAWAVRFAEVGVIEPASNFLGLDDATLSTRFAIAAEAYRAEQERIAADRAELERKAAEKQAELERRVAEERARREAEERERAAALEAERAAIAAERARIDEERKAEATQRAAEARALAEARAREEAELRAQREALAAQQREIEAAKRAAQEAERQRLAAEAAVKAEAERKARALAAAPLAAQVRELAERVGGIQGPDDARCHAILHGAASDLERYAEALEAGEVAL